MFFTKKIIGFLVVVVFFFASCSRPTANFSYDKKVEKTAPAKIPFENKSKKAETYEWDFGDGNTSQEETPSHQYSKSGTYTITLKAMKKGKVSTKTKEIEIDAPEKCLVEMETKFGTIVILLHNETPKHRDNFIKLVTEGYYDDLLFHRVINGFMIQGGDPQSKNAKPNAQLGGGGPGYQLMPEFVDTLVHIKGALAAARTPNPQKKSSGSQFYIVQGSKYTDAQIDNLERMKGIKYTARQRKILREQGGTPQLDQDYVVYGQVISGMEVIDKIATTPTNNFDRPKEDVKMKLRIIK